MNKTIFQKISVVTAVAIIIASLFSCHPDGPEDFIDYVYDAGNMGGGNQNTNDWSYPTSKPQELWAGSGSSYDPYIIKTAQDLANLSYMVNNYGDGYEYTYFKLANNIDLNYGISVNAYSSNAKEWTSIGSSNYPFKGNFDGNNYTIDGLYKNSLFGYISNGSVKKLAMGTGYIYDNSYGYVYMGSIAGSISNTTISNCTNNGTTVSSLEGLSGGLVGKMEDSTISSSENSATVSSSSHGTVGGIAGEMTNSTISSSYNYADISSSSGTAGGIAGYADDNSSYSECYNSGYVSGNTKGDIIGNKGNSENQDKNSWSYPTSKPQELWSGSGTYYDPYIIKTAQDLANLAYMVNDYGYSYEDSYFKLANNIDLNYGISVNAYSSNAKQWTSIGNEYLFKGKFNGNGYTIDGLYKNSLFGYIYEGSVEDLTMGTGYIYDNYIAGSIAIYIYETTISNCKNKETINSSSFSSEGAIGGLVGVMEDSQISSSSNYANVTSTYCTAGGIVGYMSASNIISNSYNYATVSSTCDYAGGIAGYADDDNSYCSGCYNYGSVSGSTKGNIIGNR